VSCGHLPEQHIIGDQINQICRQPHSFSERQLAAIALMEDEEEKMLL
jgi:hypothetical protein